MVQAGAGGFQGIGCRKERRRDPLARGKQRNAGRISPNILCRRAAGGGRCRAGRVRAAQRRGDRQNRRPGGRQCGCHRRQRRVCAGFHLHLGEGFGQVVQRVGGVGQACHGKQQRAGLHLRLKAAGAQRLRQRGAGQPGAATVNQDLSVVPRPEGRMRGAARFQNPQPAQRPGFLVKAVEPCPPARKQRRPARRQQAGAAIQAGQQRVGGGACLKHIELPLDLFGVGQAAGPQVQQGRLGQAWQGFVRALHHNVGPCGQRAAAPAAGLRQRQIVRAVGFIHQQRHAAGVADRRNAGDIAQNPFIGRAGQDHTGGRRRSLERSRNGVGGHTAVNSPAGVKRRGQPAHMQPAELDCMVDGFVAVAGADHRAARRRERPHRRQQAARAAVDKVPGPGSPAERRRPGHGLRQDAAGVMQVVGRRGLGRVPGIGQARDRPRLPLMPRHVQRIGSLRRRRKLVIQTMFCLCHRGLPFTDC